MPTRLYQSWITVHLLVLFLISVYDKEFSSHQKVTLLIIKHNISNNLHPVTICSLQYMGNCRNQGCILVREWKQLRAKRSWNLLWNLWRNSGWTQDIGRQQRHLQLRQDQEWKCSNKSRCSLDRNWNQWREQVSNLADLITCPHFCQML